MYCGKCGAFNNDNDKFCGSCGAELRSDDYSKSIPQKIKENLEKNNNVKLQKSNNFKSFKVKPAIIAIIVAGTMAVGGFAAGIHFSKSNQGSKTNNATKITSINTYKLNLKDFDKVMTPSFNKNEKNGLYDIKDCTVNGDNYNIEVSDGDTIVSSLENVTLIDTDFKARKVDQNTDLAAFKHAVINCHGTLEDVTINALSVEKLNNENMLLCDTVSKKTLDIESQHKAVIFNSSPYEESTERILQSTDNIIPYRDIDGDTVAQRYSNTNNNYYIKDIEIDGKIIHSFNHIGYKEEKINGVDFVFVCGQNMAGEYCEYLTTKDHCIFVHKNSSTENRNIQGTPLNVAGGIGNILMLYHNTPYYSDVYKATIDTIDNDMLYVDTPGSKYYVPAKLYSFEFRNDVHPISLKAENPLFFDFYPYVSYDKNSFVNPATAEVKQLVKVGNNYFYVLYKISNPNTNNMDGILDVVTGIFDARTMALSRTVKSDYVKNFSVMENPINVAFDLNGNILNDGFVNENGNSKCITFGTNNILGLDYYSVIRQFTDKNDGQTKYLEIVVPQSTAVIKGNEKDIAKVLK